MVSRALDTHPHEPPGNDTPPCEPALLHTNVSSCFHVFFFKNLKFCRNCGSRGDVSSPWISWVIVFDARDNTHNYGCKSNLSPITSTDNVSNKVLWCLWREKFKKRSWKTFSNPKYAVDQLNDCGERSKFLNNPLCTPF